jgi:hypothetical protein
MIQLTMFIKQGEPYTTCTPACPTQTPATSVSSYFCGDSRLGPSALPTETPFPPMLTTYRRFGNLCPQDFFDTWIDSNGKYRGPPENGFVIDQEGQPIKENRTIQTGTRLDRFGAQYSRWLSPEGTEYAYRSIPPSNIASRNGGKFYYVFEFLQNYTAAYGPVAPFYQQPGYSEQYVLYDDLQSLVNKSIVKLVYSA